MVKVKAMKNKKQTLHKKEEENENIRWGMKNKCFFKLRKNTGLMLVKMQQVHQKEVDTEEKNWTDGGEEAS